MAPGRSRRERTPVHHRVLAPAPLLVRQSWQRTRRDGPFWNALQQYGTEIVLNGHDHDYERFAPQLPTAVADANGIREFIVREAGGKSMDTFGRRDGCGQQRRAPVVDFAAARAHVGHERVLVEVRPRERRRARQWNRHLPLRVEAAPAGTDRSTGFGTFGPAAVGVRCARISGPMTYWFRLGAHPKGPLPHHEFVVDGDHVYPAGPCPRRGPARGSRSGMAWCTRPPTIRRAPASSPGTRWSGRSCIRWTATRTVAAPRRGTRPAPRPSDLRRPGATAQVGAVQECRVRR